MGGEYGGKSRKQQLLVLDRIKTRHSPYDKVIVGQIKRASV